MNIKSKSLKISFIFFYVSLAVFLLSLIIVFSSSDSSSEFFPSMREITQFIFIWIIIPACIILSATGCALAVRGIIQNRYGAITGVLLNLFIILVSCGYLWACHSGLISILEMSPQNRICYALDHNMLWLVKWELMKGADVNAEYTYNEPLLMYSIRHRNSELLNIVLDFDPDVNVYCDISGIVQTPLLCLAGNDNHPSFNYFANPKVPFYSITNTTNLPSEIKTKRTRNRMILHRLYTRKPDDWRGAGIMALSPNQPESVDNKDWDEMEVAQLLLSHGADPDLNLKSSDPERSYNAITALSLAYDDGKFELVDLLLSHGANVNVKIAYNQETLLHSAVERNDAAMVKRLIECGAEPNVPDHDTRDGSKTPLQLAVAIKDIECAKVLLEYGANVNLICSEGIGGYPPLQLAVMTGKTDMVQFLLDHDADVNAKAVNGKTALHQAVDYSKGKTDIVKLLLEHDANPNVRADYEAPAREKEIHTPYSLAQKRGYSLIADLLLSYGALAD